ncbi:hypothetical protein [Luteimonas vadosa]|uniref:General secretion pathway protein GspN n=1 Tax=Luteimonas vadosa TaxID=1165507 RepID=A0ABP9DSB8_9GAMM
MRADAAGARTWLLGAASLWALSFWVLGLAGLGSRIERLPEDPALLQPLPQLPPPVAERLGPMPQYASIGDRPLFTNDRRPKPFFINPDGEEPQNTFEFILTSVLLTPQVEMAILHPAGGGDPVRVKVGEAPDGAAAWNLVSLSRRSAVFAGPEGNTTLELRVFDGTGGEAPTVVAAPRASPTGDATAASSGRPANDTPTPDAAQPPPPGAPATQARASTEKTETGVPQTPEDQVEAIRQRIEARRAQLRRQAMTPQPPVPDPEQ